jgi:hypothetical protein
MKLLMLFPTYFTAFLAPKPVNSFEVYKPALLSKLYCDPAIAISGMLHVQDEQIVNYRLIFVRQFGLIPLGTMGSFCVHSAYKKIPLIHELIWEEL